MGYPAFHVLLAVGLSDCVPHSHNHEIGPSPTLGEVYEPRARRAQPFSIIFANHFFFKEIKYHLILYFLRRMFHIHSLKKKKQEYKVLINHSQSYEITTL
jgi:hypothetical protein